MDNMNILPACSGPLYPTPLPSVTPNSVLPKAMEYIELERTGVIYPLLAIGAIPGQPLIKGELILFMAPCNGTNIDDTTCHINLNYLIFSNITAITSTKNAHTEYSPPNGGSRPGSSPGKGAAAGSPGLGTGGTRSHKASLMKKISKK